MLKDPLELALIGATAPPDPVIVTVPVAVPRALVKKTSARITVLAVTPKR